MIRTLSWTVGAMVPSAACRDATDPADVGPGEGSAAEDAPGATSQGWSPPVAARNALIIVVDTTRADALERTETPHIDALAAAGTAVPRAWSSGTWTVPSVVSIMTGMSVRAHGYDLSTGQLGRYPPLPAAPMLAEVLSTEGFTTFGLHANPYLSEQLGFDRGFDSWRRSVDRAIPGQFLDHVSTTWTTDGRHFAYVHFIGPHSPVRPSAAAAARHGVDTAIVDPVKGMNIGEAKRDREGRKRNAYRAAYHAVLEDTDARVGAVVAALGEHRGETLIVLTSDHGELLGEHGRVGHGRHVWEALSHVPLIVDHPALPGGTESLPPALGNVAVADLVTTGLGVAHRWPAGLSQPLPLVTQREGRLAISPDGRIKAMWDPDVSTDAQVFDLAADPGETRPGRDDAGQMASARQDFEAATPQGRADGASVQLHPDTVRQLQSLGYVP